MQSQNENVATAASNVDVYAAIHRSQFYFSLPNDSVRREVVYLCERQSIFSPSSSEQYGHENETTAFACEEICF